MKRIAFVPTGRHRWLEVAQDLAARGVATPVLWIGDDHLAEAARRAFPKAHVADLAPIVSGALPAADFDGHAAGFFESQHFQRCLERGGKLAERFDRAGPIRGVTREAYVTGLALWALATLRATEAEALVMAEAPHAAVTYVLFEAADWLALPVLSFTAWSVAPVVSLRRGISGPLLPAPELDPQVLGQLDAAVAAFAAGFSGGAGQMAEPGYMTMQRRKERYYRGREQVLRPWRQARRWASGHFGRARDSVFADDALPPSDLGRRGAAAEYWRRRLRAAYDRVAAPALPKRYAYVPLHFEPERTTLPDGGDFHNQLKLLSVLRGFLPSDCALVVKEHPSQFRARMIGHLGRSGAFYRAAQGISGLHFVPLETSSAELIAGAEVVATVTGTAALEAAMLGTPALTFGDTWFAGAPGVTAYRPGLGPEALTCGEDVPGWLRLRLRQVGLPGCINPSNERYFAQVYAEPGFAAAERSNLTAALAAALEDTA